MLSNTLPCKCILFAGTAKEFGSLGSGRMVAVRHKLGGADVERVDNVALCARIDKAKFSLLIGVGACHGACAWEACVIDGEL